MNAVQKAFYSGEDYEDCYIFSPSVSKRKTVGRQAYYVRRYFRGGKDFEKTMETLAFVLMACINILLVQCLLFFNFR